MAYNSDAKMRTIMFFGGGPRKAPAAGGGGGAYQGPLDLVPGAAVAYGVRALSTAMLGQKIFRLKRDSDNAELDFEADSITGDAPVASIAVWLGVANGFFSKLYDQSGNGIDLAGSPTEFPLYIASVQGGKCGASNFDVNNGAMIGTGTITINGSLSAAYVGGVNAYLTGNESEYNIGNNNLDTFANMTDRVNYAGGDVDGDPSDYASYTTAFQFGARTFKMNGIAQNMTSFDSGGPLNQFTPTPTFQTVGNGSSGYSKLQEFLLYTSLLSGTNLDLLSTNQMTYYGITP